MCSQEKFSSGNWNALTFLFLVCALVICAPAAAHSGSYADAEVKSLPGYDGQLASRHYAGYVNVNAENNRTLYYYFVTSEKDSAADPVVLWLNGGPGCSSFDGWVYEHGPFNFIPGNSSEGLPKLVRNPYSWAKVANMLYVDSPAGVGLSYTKDYTCSDLKTGADLHIFLQKWFTKFVDFQKNDFFIAGESYAGIYVPVTSREVALGIEAKIEPKINFKGYYIGNGCTDDEYDGDAFVPFVAGHGLISFKLQEKLRAVCGGSYWNASGECEDLLFTVYDEVDDLNIYDVLEPCFHYPDETLKMATDTTHQIDTGKTKQLPRSFLTLGTSNPRKLPVRTRFTGRSWPLRYTKRNGKVTLWGQHSNDFHVPCIDDRLATVWLNSPQVREAIHALPVTDIGLWSICTIKIEYYADAGSMLPIHRNLTMAGYRALIFSGDHDMCVPYTGSEKWTSGMGYPVTDKWRPWYVGDQVAGYTESYEHNLTFATILGAGHTVPEYKPAESLYFHQRFLKNEPL